MRRGPLWVWTVLAASAWAASAENTGFRWTYGAPILEPGPEGAFDSQAVKDPSIVFHDGAWHLFYTASNGHTCRLGYASAPTLERLRDAPRHELAQAVNSGLSTPPNKYAAAPQVFFFEPQEVWYLVFQTRDSNYLPVYMTTRDIAEPDSWSAPRTLACKEEDAKWIDFWVLCDDARAYLFYTREHRDLYAMETTLERFPEGFSAPRAVFSALHEAAHIYKAAGRGEYHMIYEERDQQDIRHFRLAVARHPLGPWTATDASYATGEQLAFLDEGAPWAGEVSHIEAVRRGCNQRLEYDPDAPRLLFQSTRPGEHRGPYPLLVWRLGLMTRE